MASEIRKVELATAVSNANLRGAVAELIREDPRIVETVRRQMNAVYGGSGKLTPAELVEAFNKAILPFLADAAALGVAEAPALHVAQSALLGDADTEVAGVLEAAAAGGAGASVVAKRASSAALKTALENSGGDLRDRASANTRAVIEYQQKVQHRDQARQAAEADPQAVDSEGALMSTRLRGPEPQRPTLTVTTEEAEAFLTERAVDAAAIARREAEAAAATVVFGDTVEFILVSDSGSCKICKTISGKGFLEPDWKYIHKDCGCTVRAVSGVDDPMYKYNKEFYGPTYEAAKAKAAPNLPAEDGPDAADSDKFFAYTLKMAATLPD